MKNGCFQFKNWQRTAKSFVDANEEMEHYIAKDALDMLIDIFTQQALDEEENWNNCLVERNNRYRSVRLLIYHYRIGQYFKAGFVNRRKKR